MTVAMPSDRFAFLKALFDEAVTLAHPKTCLPPHLPPPPAHGRLIILAVGKAAGAMVEVAEQHYLQTPRFDPARLSGIGVTRHGYARPTRVIPVIEAGHPIPDQAGFKAAEQTLALADSATQDDLILVLISGGASANWIAPAKGVSFEDKQAVNRALLRSGAAIDDINTVRKHLSRIKGGRLAARAHPAQIVTLAMSDVPGDDPAIIGSGPSVPDPSTLADARAIVARFQLDLPDSVALALNDPANETPKPGDPAFAASDFHLIVRPADIFPPIEGRLREAGYDVIFLGDRVEGEAREVAALHAAMAIKLARADSQACILSGGELTVSIKGTGRGGPNQEYALALALAIEGEGGIAALSADTDGADGGGGDPSDPAGACVDHETIGSARGLGLDPAAFLDNNDSTEFFNRVGGLLLTGPTMTNVNDFRAIVVDKHRSVRA